MQNATVQPFRTASDALSAPVIAKQINGDNAYVICKQCQQYLAKSNARTYRNRLRNSHLLRLRSLRQLRQPRNHQRRRANRHKHQRKPKHRILSQNRSVSSKCIDKRNTYNRPYNQPHKKYRRDSPHRDSTGVAFSNHPLERDAQFTSNHEDLQRWE